MKMIDSDMFLASLLEGYRASYDVELNNVQDDELYATAHMHMEQVQNFILKEFRMSSADSDEYVYIFRMKRLDEEGAKAAISRAYEDGFPKIKLEHYDFRHQHMCTRLVALFVCEKAEDAALQVIKKCRIQKSFQFSLKGWMEMHTALIDLSSGSVTANPLARETAKYLKMQAAHYLRQQA